MKPLYYTFTKYTTCMKKVIMGLSLATLLTLTACSSQTKKVQDYQENKVQAITFIENSDHFKTNLGFDVHEIDSGVNSCCINRYDFEIQYSVLGDRIGYKISIRVQDRVPECTSEPTSIN